MIIAFPELVRQSAPAINVHARVLLVSEYLMQGIPPELPAAPCPDTAAIELFDYLGVIHAAQNTLKNEPYMNGFLIVDLIFQLCIDPETQRSETACMFAGDSIFILTFLDLAGEISGIVFTHCLAHSHKNYALGAVGKLFQYGYQFYAVFLKGFSVYCAVIALACESVQLVDYDHLKVAVVGIPYHSLEFLTAVVRARFGTVDVFSDYLISVFVSKFVDRSQLSVNTLVTLIVAGVPCVGCCPYHTAASSLSAFIISISREATIRSGGTSVQSASVNVIMSSGIMPVSSAFLGKNTTEFIL